MTVKKVNLVKVACFAIAALGAAAVVTTLAAPDTAFAKSKVDKVKKAVKDKKDKKVKKLKKAKKVKPLKKKEVLASYGLHASDLGGLNSLFASGKSIDDANPNSRIGRVAAFRDAVAAGQQLEADQAAAEEELAALEAPARTADEVWADLEAAMASEVATEGELSTLNEEYVAAMAYETAAAGIEADIAALEELLAAQPALETAALQEASNKPVTPEMEFAIKDFLGLE